MKNSTFLLFSRAGTAWILLLLIIALAGCAAPIGVTKVNMVDAYEDINANALSGDELSADTKIILNRYDLVEQFEQDPALAISMLHKKLYTDVRRDPLFALSEMSFYYAEKLEAPKPDENAGTPWFNPIYSRVRPGYAPDYYLMSALYAYQYLLGSLKQEPPPPYDRRFRVACDLYNRALGKAFATGEKGRLEFREGTRQLPIARLSVTIKTDSLQLSLEEFKAFLPADNYRINGLSVRNRTPGLGLPLIGILKKSAALPGDPVMPVTAFLRLTNYTVEDGKDSSSATLEFYSGYDDALTTVGAQKVPLETDSTAPGAYKLNDPSIWMQLGLKRFFSPRATKPELLITQPYQAGRIPVVFVHGTASSPLWWAEMLNTLRSDPVLRKRCQFWFFSYNSNSPIAFSATALREHLNNVVNTFDPEGKDPALRQMVVIGHSQGGLLTKMTVVQPGDKLWHSLSDKDPDQLDLTPEVRQLVKETFFFEPVPSVKRVVFISTPHRGSYRTKGWVRILIRKLTSLPKNIAQSSADLISQAKGQLKLPRGLEGKIPTSVDSMSSTNPVLMTLVELPIVPGVTAHSIIAVKGDEDYRKGNDGVVEYTSAHIDGVESEFIVRDGHSCQGNPLTIEEVRRILFEHLSSIPVK